MKSNVIRSVMLGRFLLAMWGITLAVGAVSCETSVAPQKSLGTTNSSQPAATNQTAAETDAGKPVKRPYYTCGMHPEVRSLDPDGKCPICQMPLIPVEDSVIKSPQ